MRALGRLLRLHANRCRGLPRIALLAVLVCGPGPAAFAQTGLQTQADSDGRYLAGLRTRGLFRLAEVYCLDRLADDDLSTSRRAELNLELARTRLGLSEQTVGEEQARLRQSALATATEALESARATRWGAELLLMTAEIPASKALWLVDEVRLFPDHESPRTEAIEALRAAIDIARSVKEELDRDAPSIPDRFRQNPDGLSPFQHLVIRKEADLLAARLLCDLAELQFPEPAQRGPAMRSLQQRLRPLCRGATDEPVTWRARLLHLRSVRLLADQEAFDKFRNAELAAPPEELDIEVLAEVAELDLLRGKPDRAAERLHAFRQETGRLPGDLAPLNLRALARLWQTAHDAGDAELAGQIFERIEQGHQRAVAEVGGVRSWRCSRLRDALDEARRLGPELATGIRQARTLFATGQIDAAAEEYGRLADLAGRQQRADVASELLLTRGSILLQQNRFDAAEEVFRALDASYPDSKESPQAHLLRAYCLGKRYEQAPTQSHREAYTKALEEHLQRFPDTVTGGDAALMLGQLEERRLQSTRAIDQYLRVDDRHPKAVAAHLALIRCYERIFARLKDLQQPTGEWQERAVTTLSQRVAAYPVDPERLDADRVRVLLSLARWKLEPGIARFDDADALLDRAMRATAGRGRNASETEPAAVRWRQLQTEAHQLRIISLASRGKSEDAAVLLGRLTQTSADDRLQLLSGLSRVAAEVDARAARGIAELQLQTTLNLDRQREQLTPPQIMRLDLCLAEAWAATDHGSEAIEQYERILRAHPESDEARRELAKLLMICGRPDCFLRALAEWRTLERKTRQGTAEWFAMRKEVIAAQIGAGQIDEATKLLRATELLYPEFGGGAMQTEYERLKAQLPRR